MKYNFDEIVERRNSNSVKWDFTPHDVLPMWVADMDFKTCTEITKAFSDKIESGIFGYEFISQKFKPAVKNWMKKRHYINIDENDILPVPGVLLGISAILRTFMQPGDHFILQTPVYDHFFDFAKNCQFSITENPLIKNGPTYEIDFDDLKIKAAHPQTKVLILCNPHNPVGKAWTRDDLKKIASICEEYNVIVISDEIHADLVFNPYVHIPFAEIAKDFKLVSFTCSSPCKSFNLSGLSSGCIISENKEALAQVHHMLKLQETEWLNPFSAAALIAAYENGAHWLEALKNYLHKNYLFLKEFIEEQIPEIKVNRLEATYLVWLDCSSLKMPSEKLSQNIQLFGKLRLNPGTMYGAAGEGFLRLNLGCPKDLLQDGLERLKTAIEVILTEK